MALFSRKTKKDEAQEAPKAAAVIVSAAAHTDILRNPRITEKASYAMEGSVYVFDIAPDANKKMIASAMQRIYKVSPRKVAIVNVKPKATRNMRTGKYGTKGGYKKAYVYLKKGETITIA